MELVTREVNKQPNCDATHQVLLLANKAEETLVVAKIYYSNRSVIGRSKDGDAYDVDLAAVVDTVARTGINPIPLYHDVGASAISTHSIQAHLTRA